MADCEYNTSSEESSLNNSISSECDSDNGTEAVPYQYEPLARRLGNVELNDGGNQPVNEIERAGNKIWCTCSQCAIMSTDRDSLCCQEAEPVLRKVKDFNDEGGNIVCITEHPGFRSVCLDRYVLETAFYQYRQQYGEPQETDNERRRYIAYRQLVRWCWGYLGKEVRVVLPACAVDRIRQEFPSQHYRGFQDAQ